VNQKVILRKWLVLAPLIHHKENDSLQSDSVSSFDYDFFQEKGGESKVTIKRNTGIRIDSAGVRRYVKPVEFEADSAGIINIDPLFKKMKMKLRMHSAWLKRSSPAVFGAYGGWTGMQRYGLMGKGCKTDGKVLIRACL